MTGTVKKKSHPGGMGLKHDEDHLRRGTHPRKGDASVSAFATKGNNVGLDLTTFNDLYSDNARLGEA